MADKMRPAHFIQPNHNTSRPYHAILFDTETEPIPYDIGEWQHTLKLGWACYWEVDKEKTQKNLEWCFFTTPEDFWVFVVSHLSSQEPLYLIAHNIAFDFRIVNGFDYADRASWLLDFIYYRDKTTIATYLTRQGKLQLLDLANFYPVPLEKIGSTFGLEKKPIDFKSCSFQELRDYCRRDVEILVAAWEGWLDFLDDHDLGDFKLTLSAQAMAAYRHTAMNYPIRVHSDADLCELERAAYRGGRTECFFVGEFPKGDYYQVDVNGMYTHCMATYDYPRLLRFQYGTFSPGRLKTVLQEYCAIARVVVSTEYPVFPIRMENLNVYPIGTFETVLSTPELEFATQHCTLLSIGPIALYAKAPLFRAYANYFAQLKEYYWKAGNKPFREISKRFANSLYGKFGQTDMEIDLSYEMPPMAPREAPYFDWRLKRWYRIYRIGRHTVFEKSGGESFNSFPAIPAHVTAHARMYLWSLIQQAGFNNCFYCDTDSLIVNRAGFDHLADRIDDYKLGYLKLEAQAEHLEIHGPKDYVIGDKARIKGIKKDARRLGPSSFEQSRFLGLRGALRRGSADLVTVQTVTRNLRRELKTGTVTASGKVQPFRFPL